jgi:hypothetical protein
MKGWEPLPHDTKRIRLLRAIRSRLWDEIRFCGLDYTRTRDNVLKIEQITKRIDKSAALEYG